MPQSSHGDAVARLTGPGFELHIGPAGGMRLTVGRSSYVVDSYFSYPGSPVGTNALAQAHRGERDWAPRVAQQSPGVVCIEASGQHYRLTRTVALEGHRIAIADALTNEGDRDVGVLITHRVTPDGRPLDVRVGGGPDPADDAHATHAAGAAEAGEYIEWAGFPARHLSAENPSLFLALDSSALGVLAEDSISRLQFNGSVVDGHPQFSLARFALSQRCTRTLRWTLYPLNAGAGYFDFANQVRHDWGSNFTVDGPWSFFDVVRHRELLQDPQALRHHLQRKRLSTAALMPWLDYDNYDAHAERLLSRDDYRTLMREAATALKAADPGIRCTGSMEGNIVGLPEEVVHELYEMLPADRRGRGYPLPFSDAQEALLRGQSLPRRDCLYTRPDGRHAYELYYRGPLVDATGALNEQNPRRVPMMALMVYAAPGNDHLAYWLDQARFLIEDVGLDGIYIDQFSLAFTDTQRFSYDGWDGLTVDMDPATGTITGRCVDGAWVGAGARRQLIDYVLSEGKIMVANSAAAVEEVQALPIARFMEAEFTADMLERRDGDRPPLRYYPCKGHFGSPIALGSRPEMRGEEGSAMYARYIMRTAMDYLRHGMLFYHYMTEIPESGPGSGEYGALNHMFPFTPVALHEGWVEGEERVVSAVSGEHAWAGPDPPAVRVFDMEGHPVAPRADVEHVSDGWHVDLSLHDWAEIAVIEAGAA